MSSDYTAYDTFAWIYNRHWGMKFTAGAVAVLDELVLDTLSPGAAILDVCCGTGQLAQVLSERGYHVTGLDGSSEMLAFARENAPGLEFIQSDVVDFSLPSEYDLVTCFFDSLNHVMTADELTQVFRNVRACLKPDGLFLFDMNLEPGYLADWNGYFGIVEEDHVCLFPQSYDPETRVASFDATIFRMEDYWYRSEVHLKQRCYGVDEIVSVLEEAGLKPIDTFNYDIEFGRQDLTADAKRGYWLCRKVCEIATGDL